MNESAAAALCVSREMPIFKVEIMSPSYILGSGLFNSAFQAGSHRVCHSTLTAKGRGLL